MGFLDTLLGRSKPVRPNLDVLFGLPTASLTMQAALSLQPTGTGSVCFKAAEGAAFADTEKEIRRLLDPDDDPTTGSAIEVTRDEYGFSWVVVRQQQPDVGSLVTELHAVNSTLEGQGFGPALLCTVVPFHGEIGGRERFVALVYLYKRGTFYPFAPAGGNNRDNGVELQIRSAVSGDLPIEDDLGRWLAVYGAPGL